jgi:hypothetical protein
VKIEVYVSKSELRKIKNINSDWANELNDLERSGYTTFETSHAKQWFEDFKDDVLFKHDIFFTAKETKIDEDGTK